MTDHATKYKGSPIFSCLVDFASWMIARSGLSVEDAHEAIDYAAVKAQEIIQREKAAQAGNDH